MGRNLLLWLGIAVAIIYVFSEYNNSQLNASNDLSKDYISFKSDIKAGLIEKVNINGKEITGRRKDGRSFELYLPTIDDTLLPLLEDAKVQTFGTKPEKPSVLMTIFVSWFPILLIFGAIIFISRTMRGGNGGGGGPFNFSRSKAKLLREDQVHTTFADVAGCDEAKAEVKELVDYLMDPSKFQKLGGKIPRGVLLSGQPGTGKTLLAKAISGEAKVPFFSISGSDFVEMFVGVGASRVRDMFEQAKKNCPCIIFIDEIDAVGRSRSASGVGGGHDEREQTLNQLLVEMDGFEGHEAVIVIAATNRPDILDPALLRPGRFDRQVTVGLPDVKGREQILKVHTRKIPIAEDVDISVIARGTPGFSGAELANLANEAALAAARANKNLVSMAEFELAKDKILMGTERRSMAMSEFEKSLTAYHEAGHTIVGKLVPEHDPVYKVSIIPRGRALGVTMYLPDSDKYSHTKEYIESNISSLYGGRLAEEIIFGAEKVTTGASNDIERATDLAKKMVLRWGMSSKLGPQLFCENETNSYLGGNGLQTKNLSETTQILVDEEVKEIVTRNYERAKKILEDNIDILHAMKDALMKYETLDSDQIDDLMNRRPMRDSASNSASASTLKAKEEPKNEEVKDSEENKESNVASEKVADSNANNTSNEDLKAQDKEATEKSNASKDADKSKDDNNNGWGL